MSSATEKSRVAILISGRGSNMRALIEAAAAPDYPAKIVGVISNRFDAAGLDFASAKGIPTAVIGKAGAGSAAAAEAQMTAQLEHWDVDYVCLAGFMRILGAPFVERWHGRILNIHPSLLPKFKGLDTHQRALDAGETEHGCTVHLVVPELDAGPILLQKRVPVEPNDTADSLAERVLAQEHQAYPAALKLLIEQNRIE